jgi:hypothetical protein
MGPRAGLGLSEHVRQKKKTIVYAKNRTPDSRGRSLVKLTTQIRLFRIISQYVTETFVRKQGDP